MALDYDPLDSFAGVEQTVIGRLVTRWDRDKVAYLNGIQTRAKLGAFDAYVKEAVRKNVFTNAEEAAKLFTPANIAEAIVRQNFNAEWLRRVCHATVWVSYLPIIESNGVYRYFVLRVYSNHPSIRNAAKLMYAEDNLSDQVLQAEAAARDASSTTVATQASSPVRPVDVGYD